MYAWAFQDLESTSLVELYRLHSVVLDISGLSADVIPDQESVPGLDGLAYSYGK